MEKSILLPCRNTRRISGKESSFVNLIWYRRKKILLMTKNKYQNKKYSKNRRKRFFMKIMPCTMRIKKSIPPSNVGFAYGEKKGGCLKSQEMERSQRLRSALRIHYHSDALSVVSWLRRPGDFLDTFLEWSNQAPKLNIFLSLLPKRLLLKCGLGKFKNNFRSLVLKFNW